MLDCRTLATKKLRQWRCRHEEQHELHVRRRRDGVQRQGPLWRHHIPFSTTACRLGEGARDDKAQECPLTCENWKSRARVHVRVVRRILS